MVKLFIGVGVLLFCGGAGAVFHGLPYLVLEYGFTFVIGGIVAGTGGLVLIGIGVLLREIGRLRLGLAVPQAPAKGVAEPDAAPAQDDVGPPRADGQGDLFAPGVAAGVAATTAAVAGATLAAGRGSPFDKIERALEDVLETTRGEARGAAAMGGDEPDIAGYRPDDGEMAAGEAVSAPYSGNETLALRADMTDAREAAAPPERAPEHVEPAQTERPPVSSDEGVVRVYTIGDSSFTMYSDGTIRADTPQGARFFATMDELKTYLDQRPTASSAKA